MNNNTNPKDLSINGVLYAKYEIENGICFMKIIKPIFKDGPGDDENFCAMVIGVIEQIEIKSLAYLNI